MTQSATELQIFLDVATESVLAAGAVLKEKWGKLSDSDIQEKGPGDLVTEADKLAEAEVLKVLKRHLPEHQILAEESGSLGNAKSKYLWAIRSPRWYYQLRSWFTSGCNFCRLDDRRNTDCRRGIQSL